MEVTKNSWCYLVDFDPKLFSHSSIHNSEFCQKYFPLYLGKKRKSKIALQACFEKKTVEKSCPAEKAKTLDHHNPNSSRKKTKWGKY